MSTQVRRIIVKVDTSGDKSLNAIKNQFKELNKTVKETSNSIGSLKNMFQGLLGASILGFGIREVVNLADSMQKLRDRLVNTEGSTEKAALTLSKLRDVANATNTSIEDIGTIYARLNLSLGDLGASTDAIIGLTVALQNSFRLSGSTAAEATAATIQLSQGLASGQLRGQELRSVLEQNAVLGEILAKAFKKTRGELLKFAEAEGGIKAPEFLKAISGQFNEINERAKNLKPTISEALVTGMNDLKVAFQSFNEEAGITDKIVTAIGFTFEHLGKILASAAIITIWVKWTSITLALGKALLWLKGVILSVGTTIAILTSPLYIIPVAIAAATAAIAGAVVYFVGWEKIVRTFGDAWQYLGEKIGMLEKVKNPTVNMQEIGEKAKELQNVLQGSGTGPTGKGIVQDILDIGVASQKSYVPFKTYGDALEDFANNAKGSKGGKKVSLKKQIEELNQAFLDGTIKVLPYNKKLLELTEKLSAKKGAVFQAKEMARVMKDNLNREFEYGIINIDQYNVALKKLELDDLKRKLDQGVISLKEYHKEMTEIGSEFRADSAIYTGINNYIESSGTLAQNVAKNITLVFNTLEDTLVDFVRTGTFEFKKFTQAVLEDLTRIIIRAAIIRPLANGLLGGVMNQQASGGTDAYGHYQAQAKGGAWDGGVQKFAKGGIVSSPTTFGMKSGTGLMGEAGPEAIIPLKRGANGELGVQGAGAVTVNVINNSGAQATTSETEGPNGERIIQVMIEGKVKEMFGRGSMDKTMTNLYGIQRRGN